MDKWTFKINNEPYAVRDTGPFYEVIFPDGSYRVLIPYLDDRQETGFRFEDGAWPEIAEELGELIYRETM